MRRSGPSFRTSFTRRLTGKRSSSTPSLGTSSPRSSAGSGWAGSSQRSQHLRVEDDRHPVVELRDRLVGRARDDREGPPTLLGLRVAPERPQAGQGQDVAVGSPDRERLTGLALAAPLVEGIDRDDDPVPPEGVPEHRTRTDGLGPGVERLRAFRCLLRPVRDESPTVGGDRPAVLALGDDEGLVGRGDVEPRAEVLAERLGGEPLGELGCWSLLGEATAHGTVVRPRTGTRGSGRARSEHSRVAGDGRLEPRRPSTGRAGPARPTAGRSGCRGSAVARAGACPARPRRGAARGRRSPHGRPGLPAGHRSQRRRHHRRRTARARARRSAVPAMRPRRSTPG